MKPIKKEKKIKSPTLIDAVLKSIDEVSEPKICFLGKYVLDGGMASKIFKMDFEYIKVCVYEFRVLFAKKFKNKLKHIDATELEDISAFYFVIKQWFLYEIRWRIYKDVKRNNLYHPTIEDTFKSAFRSAVISAEDIENPRDQYWHAKKRYREEFIFISECMINGVEEEEATQWIKEFYDSASMSGIKCV